MDDLICAINEIQDILNVIGGGYSIDLPQIVVIGIQSSGKSSILESLVGRGFLPRGTGVVTRRPLVLQLVRIKDSDLPDFDTDKEEFGIFLHKSNQIYEDFDEIKQEIIKCTDEVAGDNKCVSDESISLKIYSKNVVNLTLVDLPGFTKIPIGDQPEDIENQLRKMCLKYIKNPKSVILAVTAANTDIATSDAIKFARQVDPNGNRTIVVATKLDLMDHGTDAMDILTGRVIPVKLGIIGVVNRGQADINSNKTVSDGFTAEEEFFNKKYPRLGNKCGSRFLVKHLNKILINHIRKCLPDLKSRLDAMIFHYSNLVKKYTQEIVDKPQFILETISNLCFSFSKTLNGSSDQLDITELCGGARICYIFHNIFAKKLYEIDALQDLTHKNILTALHNATGPRPSLYIPEATFELLVKRQILLLKKPSISCTNLVFNEINRIIQLCIKQINLTQYPHFSDKIVEIIGNLLSERLPITENMVINLIDIELAYINTKHPDFKNALSPRLSAPEEKESTLKNGDLNDYGAESLNGLSDFDTLNASFLTEAIPNTDYNYKLTKKNAHDVGLIETLIHSYFSIVRKNIMDSVPKAIMHFLINHVESKIHSLLVKEIYGNGEQEHLFFESESVVKSRMRDKSMLKALLECQKKINNIK